MARRISLRRCDQCDADPVVRCPRCGAPICQEHRPQPGERCGSCEAEWEDGEGTRRAIKQMFAPAAFVLAGGAAFGALLPLLAALPAFGGALVVAAASTSIGVVAASSTTHLVDGVARSQFLREHARALPEARARIVPHRALQHRALPRRR